MTDSAEDAGLRHRVEGAVAGYARALEICIAGTSEPDVALAEAR